jgi:hypothetical protein
MSEFCIVLAIYIWNNLPEHSLTEPENEVRSLVLGLCISLI